MLLGWIVKWKKYGSGGGQIQDTVSAFAWSD